MEYCFYFKLFPFEKELEIVLAKNKKHLIIKMEKNLISNMIKVADLTEKDLFNGDISTVMSPRTVLHWAENTDIFKDQGYAFRITFLNKCDELEKKIISEYYQRCFGEDLPESSINVVNVKVENKENKKEKLEDFKTAISSTVRSLSNSHKIEVFLVIKFQNQQITLLNYQI